jgi:hypothetical protein
VAAAPEREQAALHLQELEPLPRASPQLAQAPVEIQQRARVARLVGDVAARDRPAAARAGRS